MIKCDCMFCKKTFEVDHHDPQYFRLKSKQTTSYVCKSCNQSFQKDAIKQTGINPHEIDKYDKFLK